MARFWLGGATGFLGSHLLRLLVRQGHSVAAVALGGGQVDGVEVEDVDILDTEQVARSAQKCDGALLATGMVSRDPADAELLHRLHVFGTRSALRGHPIIARLF